MARLIKTKRQHRQLSAVLTENTVTLTLSPSAGALSPGGTVAVAYSRQISVSNDVGGGVTYQVSAGALPAGITLNKSTGLLSGTPTTAGSNSFTIRATDAFGNTGTAAYTLAIAAE